MQVEPLNFDNTARKSNIKMLFLVAVSVLCCAFAYGFSLGLKTPAYANLTPNKSSRGSDSQELNDIPDGLKLVPIGNDVSIKGHPAVVVNFLTTRPVEEVLNEQREIWEKHGVKTIGAVSSSRGALSGDDQATRQRRMIAMWEVPPSLRKASAQGYPFQGMISRISIDGNPGSAGDQFERSLGVPIKPGSEGGVVFSSRDNGLESRTASSLNPGNVMDNVSFYETNLKRGGWKLASKERLGEGDQALIKLDFTQQEQLLQVLITPIDGRSFSGRDGMERSIVNVTKVFVAAK